MMAIDFDNLEKNPDVLYSDQDVFAMLAPEPATPGHIQVFPQKQSTILEQLPNSLVASMFSFANKMSVLLFENINCQGTNIIVENGVAAGQTEPRVSIHVIPRRENDGLNLAWTPKRLDDDTMSTVFLKLEEEAKNIVIEKEAPKPLVIEESKKEISDSENRQNMLIKQLRRIP